MLNIDIFCTNLTLNIFCKDDAYFIIFIKDIHANCVYKF